MTRKLLLAATVLAPAALLAAATGTAQAQPISGLYVGGAGGANFLQQERAQNATYRNGVRTALGGSVYHDTGYAALGNIGWGFGNGLRVELEGSYRNNRISPTAGFVSSGGKEQKFGPMVNVLFDLDVGSPYVFPYIGGGAGYQWVDRDRSITGPISVGTPFGTFASPSARSITGGTDAGFAYQAIAGLSFPIPPVVGLSLTAEYRFMGMAGDRTYSQTYIGVPGLPGRRVTVTDDYNHSLMLGLRYAFNVAPPPVIAPTPAAPAPASASRTYLVFFDWDRADLTDRARAIIAQAAQATTTVQVTRIEVSGHTDTTGTAHYNQGLSERRANIVKAELVRLGVPSAAITTQGFGFSKPLVATGPGVREPQNRRVEIVLR